MLRTSRLLYLLVFMKELEGNFQLKSYVGLDLNEEFKEDQSVLANQLFLYLFFICFALTNCNTNFSTAVKYCKIWHCFLVLFIWNQQFTELLIYRHAHSLFYLGNTIQYGNNTSHRVDKQSCTGLNVKESLKTCPLENTRDINYLQSGHLKYRQRELNSFSPHDNTRNVFLFGNMSNKLEAALQFSFSLSSEKCHCSLGMQHPTWTKISCCSVDYLFINLNYFFFVYLLID